MENNIIDKIQASTKLAHETIPNQIFISYSHKDKKWFDALKTHLTPLERENHVSVWDDTKIAPGEEWRQEITKALAAARVAVLLVSPNFLASDFIANNELPHLLAAAKDDVLTILWVAVSESQYKETEIERYHAAHDPSKPLDSLRVSQRNKVLVSICEKIKAALNP